MLAASPELPLDRLARGRRARVVGIGEDLADLADVGIVVGAEIVVERALPLGGPVVVRLGASRVALARGLARGVRVTEVAQ